MYRAIVRLFDQNARAREYGIVGAKVVEVNHFEWLSQKYANE